MLFAFSGGRERRSERRSISPIPSTGWRRRKKRDFGFLILWLAPSRTENMPEFAPGRRWFMTPAFLPKPRRGLSQERELRQVAERAGWEIVHVYKDYGISGAKGRDKRPARKTLTLGERRYVLIMVRIAFPVVGFELLRSHPLSLRCIQTHGRRFLLARSPFRWAFLGGVCSIPCDLPYGLCHDVIFGPAQVGGVA
jgi:hypothetical protein